MSAPLVSDALDPRLRPYALVGDAAALVREGLFVAEGRLVVERLLDDGRFRVRSVALTPAAAAAMQAVRSRHPDVEVIVCEQDVLRQVTGYDFHRGCIALAYRPDEDTPLTAFAGTTRVLALEGITDPDNVGGLFRTALAFGVDGVIVDRATADPLYRKAIRTSMAATLRVPFARVDSWMDGLRTMRHHGLSIVALTPRADAVDLNDFARQAPERCVVLAGSEGYGLTDASLAAADVMVKIAVDPRADSLNVVSATAIALHALRRLPAPTVGPA
jgi:tRNA G18 (ribose-2'-O)-methylase SpoU